MTVEPSGHWSLGVLIGGPVAALFILAALVLIALAIFEQVTNGDVGWYVAGFVGALVVILGITLFCFFPFKAEYHQWREVSGTVASTNSRFLSVNKGTDQKFVVTFQGSGQQWGCSDTRCASVQVGDDLTLTCKRSWQWFGTPGYDCNFVSLGSDGGE